MFHLVRGIGLMFMTYGWDILAAAVVQGSQTVHRSHLSPRVTVGLEATVTGGGDQSPVAGVVRCVSINMRGACPAG